MFFIEKGCEYLLVSIERDEGNLKNHPTFDSLSGMNSPNAMIYKQDGYAWDL